MMYYDKKTVIFHNGEFKNASEIQLAPFIQSLHYGYGVLEGIRAYKTIHGPQIFRGKEHYARFLRAAKQLNLNISYNEEELNNISYQLLEANGLSDSYIRPLAFMGDNLGLTLNNDFQLIILAWKWGRYEDSLLNVTVTDYARPVTSREFIDIKVTGSYYSSIVATTHARNKGFDEALLKDSEGFISEGLGANFFYEKGDKLYTPPVGNILPGITRFTVMKLALEMGIEVIEKNITPEDLQGIDGAFFTGTALEITGIKSIDNNPVAKKWEDTFGYQLRLKYKNKVVMGEFDNYSII